MSDVIMKFFTIEALSLRNALFKSNLEADALGKSTVMKCSRIIIFH